MWASIGEAVLCLGGLGLIGLAIWHLDRVVTSREQYRSEEKRAQRRARVDEAGRLAYERAMREYQLTGIQKEVDRFNSGAIILRTSADAAEAAKALETVRQALLSAQRLAGDHAAETSRSAVAAMEKEYAELDAQKDALLREAMIRAYKAAVAAVGNPRSITGRYRMGAFFAAQLAWAKQNPDISADNLAFLRELQREHVRQNDEEAEKATIHDK